MTAHVPKATLYAFPAGSVWSAPALLTAYEKHYTEQELEQRVVDLAKGENFSPAFLRISPEGHVPVLVVPYAHTVEDGITTKYKAIHGSSAVTSFLDEATNRSVSHSAPSLSPATVARAASQKEIIELVHKDEYDPNVLLLSFRTEEERKKGAEGLPGGFLKGRQEALERYAKEVEVEGDEKLNVFYAKKIKENGDLRAIFEGKADGSEAQKLGQQRWTDVSKLVNELEKKFEPDTPYLVGDQVSLADLHVGAYLARLLAISGATSISSSDVPESVAKLDENLTDGVKVGPKLTKLLEALFERESFKKVYADGFH
ncbi:hypothetical protein JCM8547_000578 [Rhodosporidiobolus lusitaniae]